MQDISPPVTPSKKPVFESDHTFKLMMIGDSAVGKTCLMLRFSERDVPKSYAQTIGIDFRVRTLALDGKVVKLQIWDTAGQERFRTITSACYRGASGVVIVYDITNRSSFTNVLSWVQAFEKNIPDKLLARCLIGNKCDLAKDQRQVSTKEGCDLAEEIEAKFLETSAFKDINVDELFIAMAKQLVTNEKLAAASLDTPPQTPKKLAPLSLRRAEVLDASCCQ